MISKEGAGVRLSVDCVGSGWPALIFVHGFACDRYDWSAQREALAPRFRVVTFDLPGHGESQLPAVGTIDLLARSVCEIKEQCGGGQAVLVGHSLGCRIISEVMQQSPSGVAGLVFVEGGLVAGGDAERAANGLSERLAATGFAEFIRPMFEQMFSPGADPRLRERVMSRLARIDAAFATEVLLSAVRWEANEPALLSGVHVPVLMLQSTYLDESFTWHRMEPGMTTPWTRLVTRHVPGAELLVVPGAGHFLQIEAAATVSRQIGEFAARLTA